MGTASASPSSSLSGTTFTVKRFVSLGVFAVQCLCYAVVYCAVVYCAVVYCAVVYCAVVYCAVLMWWFCDR